jgi:hypothetical protein
LGDRLGKARGGKGTEGEGTENGTQTPIQLQTSNNTLTNAFNNNGKQIKIFYHIFSSYSQVLAFVFNKKVKTIPF